ncbi:MAG: hypothetical protein H7A42_00455 [Chlamydiales bacterium]|nr:hypothetical protein [Chlamydiales bacterium]
MSNTTINQQRKLNESHASNSPATRGPEVAAGNPITQSMLFNQRRELLLEQLRLFEFLKGIATKWDPNTTEDPDLATGMISNVKEGSKSSDRSQIGVDQLEAQNDGSILSALEQEAKSPNVQASEGAANEIGLLVGAQIKTSSSSSTGREAMQPWEDSIDYRVLSASHSSIARERELRLTKAEVNGISHL